MEYFREKLMTYSTERQISTLLQIHTEISKPKVLIPSYKTQNYVDEILNEYSVKMYTYPQLSQSESKIAYSIQQQKKAGTNVYSLQQFKRKPLKKKIIRKVIVPAPSAAISTTQYVKICPCCNAKVNNKHRCEHSLCQKPCSRSRKPRAPINNDQKSVTLSKKKRAEEEEEFTPEGQEIEAEESKSSLLDHESDFQEDMDMIGEFSGTQSFLSNIERKKGKSRRKGGRKDSSTRNRGSRRRRVQQRRTSARNDGSRKQDDIPEGQEPNQQQNQKKKIMGSSEKMQLKQTIENNGQKKQIQGKPKPNTRRKKIIKKPEKKQSQVSESNIQSSFEPLSPRKDLRKKRSSTMNPKPTIQNQDKESHANNEGDIFKFRKKQPLSFFCTPEELKQGQIFTIRITDTESPPQIKKKTSTQKPSTEKHPTQKTKPHSSLPLNKQPQQIPKLIKAESENMKQQPLPQIEPLKHKQSELMSENVPEYQEEPEVNAVLDPVSDDENQEALFKNEEQGGEK